MNMKLFKHSLKARILWLLASCVALLLSSPFPAHAQKTRDENMNILRWEHSDTDIGLRRRLEIRGKAEFTDDYTDVKDVSDGGWVLIEEHRDRQSYRYEVRRDFGGGQLTRLFYVNGVAQPLDANAKAWLAKFVLDAVRQGGFDAEKRVKTILDQHGVSGVLAEIDQISGEYAKRLYYQQLLKQANLDANALRDVLRQMARNISSDYEQAQLLTSVAPMLTGKEAAIQPFFDAVGTIKSDYEQRRVLTALARMKNQSEQVLRLLLASAERLASDYEKATFLVEVSNVYTGDTRLKSAFLRAVETIKSDYERGRVLSALLKNKQIG
jgi:hypothetical protein